MNPPAKRDKRDDGLSIVIPTWNGRALLEAYLPGVVKAAAAYREQSGSPTEIVIADDASTDGTGEWLSENFPQIRLVQSAKQQGFGLNSNRGVEAAKYPLVYLLNNDVAMELATLAPLAEHFADPNVFAVTGQVFDYDTGKLSGAGQVGEFRRGFLRIHQRYFAAPAPGDAQSNEQNNVQNNVAPYLTVFASGGSVLFDREKFLQLGGFDPMFSPFGWEDVELSLRAWRRGYEVRYEPRSAVWHKFSSTIGEKFRPRHVRAIYERNRLLAHWIHLETPAEWAAHVTFLLLKLAGDTLRGRWEAWSALRQALARLDAVGRLREELRASERHPLKDVLPLQEILSRVADQLHRPEVQPLSEQTAPVRRRS